MPTIVDSLIVELGLDPSKFTKGQKEAAASFTKTKEEFRKTGKEIEDAGKKSAESIGVVAKEALALFGIFTTARGVKDFVADLVATDSALGRFAANLGVSAQTAGAWGLAAERMGGSAEATGASIQGLFDKLMAMKNLGKNMPMEYWMLGSRGGVELDRSKDVYQQMFQLATAIQNIAAREGRPAASWWGRTIGLDEGTINTIIEKGPQLREYIESLNKLAPTAENVAASQKLLDIWIRLKQEATEFGRELTMRYAPALEAASNALSKLIDLFKVLEPVSTKFTQFLTFGGLGLTDMTKFFEKLSKGIEYATDKLKSFVGYLEEMRASIMSMLSDNQITRFLGIGSSSASQAAPAQESSSVAGFWRKPYDKVKEWLGGGNKEAPAPGVSSPGASSSSASPSSQGPVSMSPRRSDVAQVITEEWRKAGMSDAGIAGILANVKSESEFNPNLRHADQPKWGGEAHYAHGLYQEGGAEWNKYDAWLKKNHPGADWRDPRLQSHFAAINLRDNYPRVWRSMNSGSKESAAQDYVSGYLKPAKHFEMSRRAQYGRGVPSIDRYTAGASPSWPLAGGFGDTSWPLAGGYAGANLSASAMNASPSYSSSSAEANFHGPITVNTQATDAHGMARDMMPALMESSRYVTQMNGGPQ
jgi:hypothetical protein